MFVIRVFINRCELKLVWQVTKRCRAEFNEYPAMDAIKEALYSELKEGSLLYLLQLWSDFDKNSLLEILV